MFAMLGFLENFSEIRKKILLNMQVTLNNL